MDERTPKPPLADDPAFLESLSDLDEGLIDDPVPAKRATPLPPPTPLARPPADQHQGLTPEASAALAAASAALAAFDAPAEPGTAAGGARANRPTPLDAFTPVKPATAPSRSHASSVTSASPAVANPDSFWRGRLLMVVLMIGLMLAGAAGAWIFREPLTRALTRWHVLG